MSWYFCIMRKSKSLSSLSRSARYYRKNKKARDKKKKYDRKLQKRPDQVRKRVEANRANRKAGTYGNGDGKDYDHATKRMVSAKTNRGRRGEGGRKKGSKKRKK